MNLQNLAFKINSYRTAAGISFAANLIDDGETMEVVCDVNTDATLFVVASEQQVLVVTPLFREADVKAGMLDELNKTLLTLSPIIPLSSIGLQEDSYILFGAMPIDTPFESIVHELEVQADNTNEVLAALTIYFDTNEEAEGF